MGEVTREMLEALPRKTARELFAGVPMGRGYDDRLLQAVEMAMNHEWWRGYFFGRDDQRADGQSEDRS